MAGREGGLNFVTAVGIALSPLCFASQNIGERQRSGSDEERGWKDGI